MIPRGLRMAYLVSRYPAISHTFILREVLGMRERGFDVRVASINDPDRDDARLTTCERTEAQQAFFIKRQGAMGALRAHAATFGLSPIRYLRALAFSMRLSSGGVTGLIYTLFYFLEGVILGRWMKREDLHHLHVHFATPAATVGLIASHLFGNTLSITVHGPDEFFDVSRYQLANKVRGAAFLFTIGSFARSQVLKIASPSEWSKVEVLPLGVDTAEFQPREAPEDRPWFEILCVGRLVPAKGQHVLLEAVRGLTEQGRQVHVRFVGDGPDRESLERAADEHRLRNYVTFEGAVNQDRIRDYYRHADAFVLASFAEGIPVVLMEAMAMEIPCVTTFVNGIPELIRSGEDGLLVPPADAEALALAISRLMDDPDLRRRLGTAGRRRIISHYHLPTNLDRLAAAFRRRLEHVA